MELTRIRRTMLVVLGAVLTVGGCTSGTADKADGTAGGTAGGAPATPAAGPAATLMMDDITAVFENGATVPQYAYITDLHDGCGYTAGWVGFCSQSGDMLGLVKSYNAVAPHNVLAKYTAVLQRLADSGSEDTGALGEAFVRDWKKAALDPAFRRLQIKVGHATYLTPAMKLSAQEGVKSALGLENLFDTGLMMGQASGDCDGMVKIAQETDKVLGGNPASGVNEAKWLARFNAVRQQHMKHPCTPDRKNDWPQAVDRSQALQELADHGEWDLKAPLTVSADFKISISKPQD
ncbi:chitosanase [Streptomyces albospinus]|uniref:chitosanase n=1 Tax=Streptomyces albospinus TaxID=285515 RepID=UPI001671141A|nr:chitosanase [Streptomyces albospinus]